MDWTQSFNFLGAWLTAIIPAGLIVAGLAGYIGKLISQKVLAKEQNRLNEGLKRLDNELEYMNHIKIDTRSNKLKYYQEILDLVAELLGVFDSYVLGGIEKDEAKKKLHVFNSSRIKTYGRLALFAPQDVMDNHDILLDHLLLISQDKEPYTWSVIRGHVIGLINSMRKDIGKNNDPITYNGKL
jgi:hypothetical protein